MPEPYGIYEGTVGEKEYAHGRDRGRADADALAETGWEAMIDALELDGWEMLRTACAPRSRAFYLGWLRGFREVSR